MLLAVCALAASASAQTFVVNVPGDEFETEACMATNPCSLRDAIVRANEDSEADTIEFEGPFSIKVENGTLPAIENPVTIDATTLAGYTGAPLVELDGTEAFNEGARDGLDVLAGPTVIEGLAIGNFETGIHVDTADPVHICGDYLGTSPSGMQAEPNVVGVEVGGTANEAQIGSGCPGGRGNLISGNEDFGIRDSGLGTRIAANRIGTDAHGGPLGNGVGFKPNGVPGGGRGLRHRNRRWHLHRPGKRRGRQHDRLQRSHRSRARERGRKRDDRPELDLLQHRPRDRNGWAETPGAEPRGRPDGGTGDDGERRAGRKSQ